MMYNLDEIEEKKEIRFEDKIFPVKEPTVADYFEYLKKLQGEELKSEKEIVDYLIEKTELKIDISKLRMGQFRRLQKILTELIIGKEEKKTE